MAQASPVPLTAQQLFVRASLLGMLKASPVWDRFCGWMLAIGGVVLGFLLGNLDSIQPYLSVEAIKRFMWLLLIAFAFGFLEKFAASMVEAGIGAAEEVESSIVHLFKGEVEVVEAPFDAEAMLGEIKSALWFPAKRLFGFGAKRAASDPNAGLKYGAKILQMQFYFAVFETFFFVLAGSVLVRGIG
jgi:hypothetical protein